MTWYSAICLFIEWQRNILCHDWLSCHPCTACSFVDVLREGCSQECGSYATATATTPVGPTLSLCRCIAAYYAKGKCGSRQRCKPLLPHILHFSALNNVSYAYPFYCIFSMSRDVHQRCLLLLPSAASPGTTPSFCSCLVSLSICISLFGVLSAHFHTCLASSTANWNCAHHCVCGWLFFVVWHCFKLLSVDLIPLCNCVFWCPLTNTAGVANHKWAHSADVLAHFVNVLLCVPPEYLLTCLLACWLSHWLAWVFLNGNLLMLSKIYILLFFFFFN